MVLLISLSSCWHPFVFWTGLWRLNFTQAGKTKRVGQVQRKMETNQPKKLFISNDRYVMFDPLNFIEFSPNFFQSALTKRDVNLITSEMKKNSSHELIMLESK